MWKLSEISEGISVSVDYVGLWIKSDDIYLGHVDQPKPTKPKSRLGRLLPTLIPQLLDLGLAQQVEKDILIRFNYSGM